MALYLLKLDFKSAVRLGVPGRDDQTVRESISAEQYFSWLSLGWIRLFGEQDYEASVLSPFRNREFPWIASDLFPEYQDTIWLPAPRWHTNHDDGSVIHKKKRTNWISWDSFCDCLANGKAPQEKDFRKPVKIEMINNVQIMRKAATSLSLGTVDDNNRPKPYFTATIAGQQRNTGSDDLLKFRGLLDCTSPQLAEKIETVIEFMKDDGFGGNRSTGLGVLQTAAIVASTKNLRIKSPEPRDTTSKNSRVILSSCYPTPKMLEAIACSAPGANSYVLNVRAGWIYGANGRATDIRKPSNFVFDTGSVFSTMPEGQMIDCSVSNLPCYRYAIPFVV